MLFKNSLLLIVGFTLGTGLFGCGIALNDPPPPPEHAPEFFESELGCLNETGAQFSRYIEGRGEQKEIQDLSNCLSRALTLFTNTVQGRDSNRYSEIELTRFIQTFFLSGYSIPKPFAISIMRLKRGLFGGSDTHLTHEEISNFKNLLTVIGEESVRLAHYFPLDFERLSLARPSEIDAMVRDFQIAGLRIANQLGLNSESYSFADLTVFIQETQTFFRATGFESDTFAVLLSEMNLLRAAKQIFIGGSSTEISKEEWKILLHEGLDWYANLSKWVHLFTHFPSLTSGPALERLLDTATEIKNLISRTVARQPEQVLRFELFDHLVDAWMENHTLDALPGHIEPNALKAVLRPLVRKVVSGGLGLQTQSSTEGLSLLGIERIWYHLQRWGRGQRALTLLFQSVAEDRGSARPAYPRIELYNKARTLTTLGVDTNALRPILHILRSSKRHVSLPQNDTQLLFTRNGDLLSYAHLSELHWIQATARFLFQGYSQDPRVSRSWYPRLSFEELDRIYRDLWDSFTQMGFFDRRQTDWAEQRFRDANLFTFHANGDDWLDFDEAVDLAQIMLSSQRAASWIFNDLNQRCDARVSPLTSAPALDVDCVRTALRRQSVRYFDHFPGFLSEIQTLSREERSELWFLLENVGRRMGYSSVRIEENDIQGIYQGVQYIESLFLAFDTNRNETLSMREADAAFPRFDPLLKVISGFKRPRIRRYLYHEILDHGGLIEENLRGFLPVLSRAWLPDRWLDYEAKRITILRILSEIKTRAEAN